MDLNIATPEMHKDGACPVYVNGSAVKKGGNPYAVVGLGPRTELYFDTPAEAGQLAAVLLTAQRLLEAAMVPHPFRPGDDIGQFRCADCSIIRGHHPEGSDGGTVQS